eukprot:scaffold1471_cov73-Phaeocystis_antarctica.AAC.5
MGGLVVEWQTEQARSSLARRTGRAISWEECRSSKLYHAAASGCVTRVDSLLDEGAADPDWINPEGGLIDR